MPRSHPITARVAAFGAPTASEFGVDIGNRELQSIANVGAAATTEAAEIGVRLDISLISEFAAEPATYGGASDQVLNVFETSGWEDNTRESQLTLGTAMITAAQGVDHYLRAPTSDRS